MNNEEKKIIGYDGQTGNPIYENVPVQIQNNNGIESLETPVDNEMVNENKKIIGYDGQTGNPIYENSVVQTQSVPSTPPKKKNNAIIIIIIALVIFIIIIPILIVFFVFGLIGNIDSNTINNSNIIETSNKESTYYGESFEIKYKYPWKESTATQNGEEIKALSYNNGQIRFAPIACTSLSSTTSSDFSTEAGKKSLYNDIYNLWAKSGKLTKITDNFVILKDDIYYMAVEYSDSNSLEGIVYFLVYEKNNAAISFTTLVKGDKKEANKIILELLKNININTKYDNELAESLDSLSNWNRFSSKRTGLLGNKKNIEGGWRHLEEDDNYWIFKNGEFYYYQSEKVLTDNYWYGTYRVYTGKEGFSKVGLEESKIDSLVARNKDITEKDIYTLIFTPKKIISGGEDKSSTNLGTEDWHYVWILVDHGKEGIEGQVVNVKNANTSYFVKVKD